MLVTLQHAAIEPLWENLNLTVAPGEFLAVLGPNGVGKSSLINVLLGSRSLTSGHASVDARVGYIPQQRMFPSGLPLRTRDLVSLSLAHGVIRGRHASRRRVDALLEEVGALGIADYRVSELSGGQQQLVRQAQALAGDPELLLCDEPLLSLDLAMQRRVVEMLAKRCREHGTGVICVTHSINPMLHLVDRVLYLAPGGHEVGTVDEVMTSETLTRLYGLPVTVARINDQLVVV